MAGDTERRSCSCSYSRLWRGAARKAILLRGTAREGPALVVLREGAGAQQGRVRRAPLGAVLWQTRKVAVCLLVRGAGALSRLPQARYLGHGRGWWRRVVVAVIVFVAPVVTTIVPGLRLYPLLGLLPVDVRLVRDGSWSGGRAMRAVILRQFLIAVVNVCVEGFALQRRLHRVKSIRVRLRHG